MESGWNDSYKIPGGLRMLLIPTHVVELIMAMIADIFSLDSAKSHTNVIFLEVYCPVTLLVYSISWSMPITNNLTISR